MTYNHPEFPTQQSLADRLQALPTSTVYGQLTGSSVWGHRMADLVPRHMQESFVRWVALGREDQLGGFLGALLRNDLMGAFGKADEINSAAMRNWTVFLYNYAPTGCFGSPDRVRSWPGLLREDS